MSQDVTLIKNDNHLVLMLLSNEDQNHFISNPPPSVNNLLLNYFEIDGNSFHGNQYEIVLKTKREIIFTFIYKICSLKLSFKNLILFSD